MEVLENVLMNFLTLKIENLALFKLVQVHLSSNEFFCLS